MREPLRVRLADERQAVALANELVGIPGIAVRADQGTWEVAVGGGSDRLIVRVLDAVRKALVGHRSASALVLLDGREYRLYGDER